MNMIFVVSALTVTVLIAGAVLAQVEAPPVKDECQWMYDKALDSAMKADKALSSGWLVEGHRDESERSLLFAQLYIACKTRTRR